MWVKKGVILMARINTWLLKMHQNALFMNLRWNERGKLLPITNPYRRFFHMNDLQFDLIILIATYFMFFFLYR